MVVYNPYLDLDAELSSGDIENVRSGEAEAVEGTGRELKSVIDEEVKDELEVNGSPTITTPVNLPSSHASTPGPIAETSLKPPVRATAPTIKKSASRDELDDSLHRHISWAGRRPSAGAVVVPGAVAGGVGVPTIQQQQPPVNSDCSR